MLEFSAGVMWGGPGGGGGPVNPDGTQNPSTVSAVPIMTSNTAPFGVVTVSANYYSDAGAYGLFDGDPLSLYGWYPATPLQWLGYQFPIAQQINKVGLMPVENWLGRAPAKYHVEASNDGTTWTRLATSPGYEAYDFAAGSYKWFGFVNAASYLRYRLLFESGATNTVETGEAYLSLAGVSLVAAT